MHEPIHLLLDEGVPEKLRHAFSEAFIVETVRYRGWTGMRNGDSLRLAEASFDALVTVDKRLRHQQNVSGRSIAVIVLDAAGTKFTDLLPLLPAAEADIGEQDRARCSSWRYNRHCAPDWPLLK